MNTPSTPPHLAHQPDLGTGVTYASATVDLTGVSGALLAFVEWLGKVHMAMLSFPVVITSGSDGQHSIGSKHYVGKAIDLRTSDKSYSANDLVLAFINYNAPGRGVGCFDERHLKSGAHLHLEVE